MIMLALPGVRAAYFFGLVLWIVDFLNNHCPESLNELQTSQDLCIMHLLVL